MIEEPTLESTGDELVLVEELDALDVELLPVEAVRAAVDVELLTLVTIITS
jgi:hypothetical protein